MSLRDMHDAFKKRAQVVVRTQMQVAIDKLKQEDPKRFAELLKRAQSEEYDRRCAQATEAKRFQAAVEYAREAELERARRFCRPVVVGLPNIDMSRVHGMVAYRVWNWDTVGLRSTARGYHWKEMNFADRVPEPHNQSGFYSVKLTGLGVLTSGASYFGIGRQSVSGFVELLGRVEEHSDGILRAEVARLVCLFVTSENESIDSVVPRLHELYPTTPVFVLNPEQLADVVMREVLRQRFEGRDWPEPSVPVVEDGWPTEGTIVSAIWTESRVSGTLYLQLKLEVCPFVHAGRTIGRLYCAVVGLSMVRFGEIVGAVIDFPQGAGVDEQLQGLRVPIGLELVHFQGVDRFRVRIRM